MNSFGDVVRPINGWFDMADWLIGNLDAMRVGCILELGPSDTFVTSNDQEVVCAQIQALHNGVFWLRLSEVVLDAPLLADFSTEGLPLDVWRYDDLFEDCTHGYVFSADKQMIAQACVTWFRNRQVAAHREVVLIAGREDHAPC